MARGMDVAHMLLDNAQLGKISKHQGVAELQRWQKDPVNPAFAGGWPRGGAWVIIWTLWTPFSNTTVPKAEPSDEEPLSNPHCDGCHRHLVRVRLGPRLHPAAGGVLPEGDP